MLKDLSRLAGMARLYARVGLPRLSPRQAWMMVRYWLRTAIGGEKIPWLIEFSITYRCNCHCKHCSVSNYFADAKMDKELTFAEITSVVDQAAALGIPKLDYFGGEPLIRQDIAALVQYARQKGIYVSLTTNAWLLDEKMLADLKAAGINCVNVSLDSVEEEEHDRLRGLNGVYKRAVAAVRLCHQHGVPCIVSTYATRRRIEGFATADDTSMLTAIIRFAKDLKATGIRILFPIISGEWVKKKEIELSPEEKRFVIDRIDPAFAFIEGAYSVVKKHKVCQALSGKILNISPYGDIQLCVAFPNTFGNIKEKSLKDLICGMWAHPIYQKNRNGSCCSTEDLLV